MKKMLVFVAIVSLVAGSLFAEERVLIDFAKLIADTRVEVDTPDGPIGQNPNYPDDPDDPGSTQNQNERTMMDFSNARFVGSFTDQQLKAQRSSLAIQNWEVRLSSSARTIDNMVNSFTRETTSRGGDGRYFDEDTPVMGVRVRFPREAYNARARIVPPFEILAYESLEEEEEDDNGNTFKYRFENGYGVVHNVGTIKSLEVTVYGLNFPHGLAVNLIDDQGRERSIFMGYLNFEGWGKLVWNNPQYIQEIRNRDLRLVPFYPNSIPFIKFNGFEIIRDASAPGGDFIAYFKDVNVVYDKAILTEDRDIDDEDVWGIINDRENTRSVWEMERFGQNQILRVIEQQRLAREPNFDDPSRREEE